MAKIRVQDLASMMGITNQDLIFKLRSIGVRVEGDDAHIDKDIIAAIIEGKSLPHPREVILRDETTDSSTPALRRGPVGRRMPKNPLRPSRPRSMIQKVEPKIRTIPTSEKPKAQPAAEEKKDAAATAQQAAASEAAAQTKAAPEQPAAEEAAKKAPTEKAPAKTTPAKKTGAEEAKEPAKQAGRKEDRREIKRDEKKTKRPRKAAAREEEEDLTQLRGSLEEIEAVQEELEKAPPAAAASVVTGSRRKRRAERKQDERERAEQGQVLPFKQQKPEAPVMISEGMTVRDFAEKLGVKSKDLITALFKRGVMATINHVLEPELAEQLAEEMGIETMVVSFEEEVQLKRELATGEDTGDKQARAPVVTIMGHVDHGKTSLLDAIRSSSVAEGEEGGITQHIGAYRVVTGDRPIVFLDTPGHEAFTMMRSRGAQVTDLVILMVAADDGVMPQTEEAIDHARAAGVPIVVAINKIDKDNANPDRVKKQLADKGLLVEDWGGEVVAVPMSALKGEGIDELLEMILLTSDLLELEASPGMPAHGTVLEARKDIGRGVVATVLVQEGTLAVSDTFVSGATWGRVRAMTDEHGERHERIGPSTPVEVTGFNDLPEAGDLFQVVEDEQKARSIAEFRSHEQRQRELAPQVGKMSLEQLFDKIEEGETKELPVILKADVQGSVEVLRDSLEKLSTDKVRVRVNRAALGAVSTNDVTLAAASDAIIIGFNVRPERNASDLAEKEGVEIRLYTVIYDLTSDLRNAMTGLLDPVHREVTRGRAEVRELFKVPKAGMAAGCHVVEGVIPRNAQARLLRDNVVVHDGKIGSLRRFKDDVPEVRTGFDCGIALERFQDFKPGDIIEAYQREEVAPEL